VLGQFRERRSSEHSSIESGDFSMPQDIIASLRVMREEMRQRLMQAPEYRALEALDRSIGEISAILRELQNAPATPEQPEVAPDAPPPDAMRTTAGSGRNAIANAFAETLAARMDQRSPARPAAFPLARAAGA